ncbi:hypothetical protein [Streptomyces sp. CC219B]|uniref:hypothetical protein n=1 Tax=Streptomyces sp. CC219B TaxID=3044574 RepID=UPI0024A843FA|nr:hypothetical protein [Streptomyces sp. CC219B]
MTQSLLAEAERGPKSGALPLSLPRRALRAVAIVSCLPYVGLKVAWLAGSHIGIPEGSSLLEHRTAMAVANGITLLMDSGVIVLALVLTRPWGLRVPAWLLAVPVWVATGLLAPIMTGFPLQLLVRLLGGTVSTADDTGGDSAAAPFLHEWVFGVVYGGFIVQGLALGTLFVLYARDRWGELWHGRIWDLPRGSGASVRRTGAVAAAVAALFPLACHLLWACGGTAGLSAGRIADRTTDFHVLQAVDVLFLLAAVAGAWLLAFRSAPVLPVGVPLALAWVGSGAVACWGAWLSLASLTGTDDVGDRLTPAMHFAYAGQMITGILVAAVGAHFLAERSAVLLRRRT